MAFVVEPTAQTARASAEEAPLRAFFARISLHSLPPAEGRLVEFLLLLPVAALIICVFRNLIGLQSFGTFAPAPRHNPLVLVTLTSAATTRR